MSFRLPLTLLLFILSAYPLWSQQLKVIDAENKNPLEGVTLLSESPKAFAVTNLYGEVDIQEFKGSAEIQFRSLGYENINVSYQELEEKEFVLELVAYDMQLEEVVISANRWRQNSSEIAANVASIDPKDIQLQNPQTAADMLAASGKVFIQKSQQGGGSPMIRGFATNRLLYSVDGVRMNTAIFRGGNIQNVINLDPFTLENTEILFGPNSVSYGSDAIGGVMSFKTYEPQFSLDDKILVKGSALSRYSTANEEITGHLDLNLGFKKWAFYTSFTNWNYGDLRQGSDGPDDYLKSSYVERRNGEDVIIDQRDQLLQVPSEYSQTNFLQKIRFQASEHWEITYSLNYSETSAYGRYDRHNRERDGLPRYAQWDYGPQKWLMNLLAIENYQETKIYDQMVLRLAQQNFQESRISRDFNDPLREIRKEEVDAYSINVDLNKRLGARNTLFYGAEWVTNEVNSRGEIENIENGIKTKGPSRYPNSSWTSIAAFMSNEFKLNEKINLLGGLRYNYYLVDVDFSDNQEFYPLPNSKAKLGNNSVSGSIGAVMKPNDKWVIKTNFGTAFRAPNVDDIGKVFDSEPGAVVVPNPSLDAEYAYNFDFGVAKIFGDFLKVDATAFYTILENAMVRRDFTLDGQDSILYDGELSKVQAIQNAAEANIYGLQFGFELKIKPYLTLSSDLNYQKGEEETEDGEISPSRHAAPMFGVGRLTFEKKRTRVQFYVQYQGGFDADEIAISERSKTEIYALNEQGLAYAPEWHTYNLKIQQGFVDNFSISIGVENIANLRYRPYSSGISAPGRNFVFSVKATL